MKKIILLLTLLFNLSYGCATCALMVPSVEVDISVEVKKEKLESIHFTWNFSDVYTEGLKEQYDKNQNSKFDDTEIEQIHQAMLDYLKPKDMISFIRYSDDNTTEAYALKPNYENFKLAIVKNVLVFTYTAKVQKNIFHNSNISITCQDDEGYFSFNMKELMVSENSLQHRKNLYLFTASILFQDELQVDEKTAIKSENKEEDNRSQELERENLEIEEVSLQESYLLESIEKIKTLFTSIKDEKNPMTYLVLLFFAFIYGAIHAMGPGHGKTLVASYFLANERSYSKALFISLAIGVVHTFSAFLLTVVIYFVLNTLLAQFLDDTVYYTTKVSAFIIIFIALYLIYKKYSIYKKIEEEKQKPSFTFSTSPHLSSCGCSSCKVDKNSTDAALIISAGIIPCPGTTTLFIFAISTGLYYAGFISALVMSLGMSSVIFVSALLSTIIRKKALHSSDRLKKYLEYISLVFIFILGIILLLA